MFIEDLDELKKYGEALLRLPSVTSSENIDQLAGLIYRASWCHFTCEESFFSPDESIERSPLMSEYKRIRDDFHVCFDPESRKVRALELTRLFHDGEVLLIDLYKNATELTLHKKMSLIANHFEMCKKLVTPATTAWFNEGKAVKDLWDNVLGKMAEHFYISKA